MWHDNVNGHGQMVANITSNAYNAVHKQIHDEFQYIPVHFVNSVLFQ